MPEFTTVEVPRGQFYGWGREPGQELILKVISYDEDGGTDANKKVCPQVVGTAVEPSVSWRENGTKKLDIAAGEMVTLTAGQYAVKSALKAAEPRPGDLLRFVFESTYKTDNGTGKEITVQIARGTSGAVSEEDV